MKTPAHLAAMHDDSALRAAFARAFGGRAPAALARAPGRINLIGEHTDYNGLPVLPFALPHAVRIAFAPRDDARIVLRHAREEHPPSEFIASPAIEHDPPGSWANYVKAAVEHFARLLLETSGAAARGFDALVDGDIPQAGGLSSSSALVVATALAFCEVNALSLPPLELASHCAAAERYVGTQGGGMDQAASILGAPGCALRIDFFPLAATPVPFPEGWAVLACHSLVRAAKTEEARAEFNRRVGECRVAAALLGRALDRPEAPRLGDFAKEFGTAACVRALGEAVPPDSKILARARHVFEEAERVAEATRALAAGDMRTLGRLMSDAHASARDLYEISGPALEELVRLFLEGGALGARLTGAGFGGFAIALGEEDPLARLMAEVDDRFYRVRAPARPLEELRFIARPAEGARVVRV
ncbi:MAG TPA: galactokinase [Planctomycetes bacterium]|nr:galactokinase [Planctomycetota bacterium]